MPAMPAYFHFVIACIVGRGANINREIEFRVELSYNHCGVDLDVPVEMEKCTLPITGAASLRVTDAAAPTKRRRFLIPPTKAIFRNGGVGSPPAPCGGRDVERPCPLLQRQHGHDFEAQGMSSHLMRPGALERLT